VSGFQLSSAYRKTGTVHAEAVAAPSSNAAKKTQIVGSVRGIISPFYFWP
jgi:hypothetical protein